MSPKGYHYSKSVERKLRRFKAEMESKYYKPGTVRQYRNYAGLYLEWIEEKGYDIDEVTYSQFIDFVSTIPEQLRKHRKTISHRKTAQIILSVRHYYTCLDIDYNPASGVYLKGVRRRAVRVNIRYAKLLKCAQDYPTYTDRDKRNKVILGILIHQGLVTGELDKLEPRHIKLKQGKLEVPQTGLMNGRILKLDPVQAIEMQAYLQIIRPRMLENLHLPRVAKKPDQIDPMIKEKLFFSENGNLSIKNSLYHMFKALRKKHPKITSAKEIRNTVIAEWLKEKDVRIVQYMAGHRYVSSTERYQEVNLTELKEGLARYHPLR